MVADSPPARKTFLMQGVKYATECLASSFKLSLLLHQLTCVRIWAGLTLIWEQTLLGWKESSLLPGRFIALTELLCVKIEVAICAKKPKQFLVEEARHKCLVPGIKFAKLYIWSSDLASRTFSHFGFVSKNICNSERSLTPVSKVLVFRWRWVWM